MNTLNGDPTTEKLLPLIEAAASVGVEVFCVDAGWYAESPGWGDEIGTWKPSTWRFPGGLEEVIGAIRSRGMVPGLWLEPEVVSVRSATADALPPDAFFQRGGVRINEGGRFHLDLRHPAARAFLDSIVDGLISEFGIGYFKFDYNSDVGPGTDTSAESVGAGLLAHNRAHAEWIAALLDRHPDLILENCASGAMRSDAALLSQMQLQSTSDQQDPLSYPPIAAAAPLLMLPEQAANWAYPQPEMDEESSTFTLVTGLAGRLYLSGHLDEMSDSQRRLVREAVEFAKVMRSDLVRSVPSWPLGLPGWDDCWIAVALHCADRVMIAVWHRGEDVDGVDLHLTRYRGREMEVTSTFPASLPSWGATWNPDSGVFAVRSSIPGPSARIFVLASKN